jgi:phosphoketolase
MDRGTTTTLIDMVMLSKVSRVHQALDAIKHIPQLGLEAAPTAPSLTSAWTASEWRS